jgi:hypothetical protein
MPAIDVRAVSATGRGGDDPPGPGAGGDNHLSLAAEFWRALNKGDVGVAEEVARRIEPPPARSFAFDDEGGSLRDRGASPGSPAGMGLSAGTPAAVEQAWNASKKVNLMLGSGEWCLAAVTTTMRSDDFTACTLGRGGTPDGCPKTTHALVGGKGKTPVLRLDVADSTGMLVIVCPVSRAGVKQTACFSRPTLRLSTCAAELREGNRWEALLGMRFRPLVWRVLLEAAGEGCATQGGGMDQKPPPAAVKAGTHTPGRDPVAYGLAKLDLASDERSSPPEEREAVTAAPGLESILKDFATGAAREQRAARDVATARSLRSELDPLGDRGRHPRRKKTGRGISADRAWGDPTAGEARAGPAVKRTRRAARRKASPSRKVRARAWESASESSAEGIERGDAGGPAGRARERRDWDSSSAGSADHTASPPTGDGSSRDDDSDAPPHGEAVKFHTQYLKNHLYELELRFASLQATVDKLVGKEVELREELAAETQRGLQNEASLGDVISKLRGRVRTLERVGSRGSTVGGLGGPRYVTHPELDARDYLSFAEAKEEIGAEIRVMGLPARLGPRLGELEAATFGVGGAFELLLGRLKDLEERQVGKAVTIGGHTFRDAGAVKLWSDLLGDDEIHRFAWDAKAQLVACVDNALTTAATVRQEGDAIKAGYGSYRSARMGATFSVSYPEVLFKATESKAAAVHQGFTFQSAFSSAEVYDGDSEHSTRNSYKDRLSANQEIHQRAIDEEFPPDQVIHSKTNAIFSAILRKGYYQAVGFLDSLMPFYKLLTGAGLTKAEAWDNKILTYAMSVFASVHRVRTVTSETKTHTMMFGVMRATELLEEYTKAGWIRHSSVSAAMVFASLQKDGKGKADSGKLLADVIAEHKLTKAATKAVTDELRTLKTKNAGTWKT